MSFISLIFLLFFLIVFLLYSLIEDRFKYILLLIASYIFYSYWDWRYFPLLLGSSFIDYYCAQKMGKLETKKQRRPWLWVSLIINLGLLIGFKYWNFIGYNLNSVLGSHIQVHDLLLPLGLSFYTLQTLSYSFDIYLGKTKPERHFGYFCLYVSFFPQLVAGPIERSRRLLPQLKTLTRATHHQFRYGVLLVIWGFFLKVVIADNLISFIGSVYFTETLFPFWLYWFVGGLVSFKIYCDFMAYSEIARGLALLFGVKLTLNFKRPFLATNIRGFWQRWHISLTRWIGDYIHIPLLQRFKSYSGRALVTVFTLCLIGLWHGASWNFILFGLFHGIITILWTPLADLFRWAFNFRFSIRQFWGRVILAIVLLLSAPIFYVMDTETLFSILKSMFDFKTFSTPLSYDLWKNDSYLLIEALFGIVLLTGYSFMAEYRNTEMVEVFATSRSIFRWAIAVVFILLIFMFGNFTNENFTYFEF
ncbi:MAG: MBOAT family O-acyltransferase [Methylococcales bacterium]|nr:MBOAT family O-acyltransferase [Methylococcales bacterium]